MAIHLFIVHFPVALLVTGAGVDCVGTLLRDRPTRRWGGILLFLGVGASLLAFFTGQGALDAYGWQTAAPPPPSVEAHVQWGGPGVWLLAGAGVLRAMWRERLDGVQGWINLAVALAAAVFVVAITFSGTAIRHGG